MAPPSAAFSSGTEQESGARHGPAPIVLVRMRQDAQTTEYVRRRTAEGRSIREIKRCLKRYAARQLFRELEALPKRA